MSDYPDPRALEPDPLEQAAREAVVALRFVQPNTALQAVRSRCETAAVALEAALEGKR